MNHTKFTFAVYGEPLTRKVISLGITPSKLCLYFFFVPITLSLWGAWDAWAFDKSLIDGSDGWVTYFENISWSISMFLIFPFLVGRTPYFYQEIPKLFNHLLEKVINPKDEDIESFNKWLSKRFNLRYIWVVFFTSTCVLSYLYFYDILGEAKDVGWMTTGSFFTNSSTNHGLTPIGIYAGLIQGILIYWIMNMLYIGSVFVWGLYTFFNHDTLIIEADAMHVDGCCGLKRIGDVAMILNMNLLLLGIYLSLKVFDKIYIQKIPITEDMGNLTTLGAFALFAPLFFFLSLGVAHNKMKTARNNFLFPLHEKSKELIHAIGEANLKDAKDLLSSLSEAEKNRTEMRKNFAVWPFNFESIQSFIASIIVPILPIITVAINEIIKVIK